MKREAVGTRGAAGSLGVPHWPLQPKNPGAGSPSGQRVQELYKPDGADLLPRASPVAHPVLTYSLRPGVLAGGVSTQHPPSSSLTPPEG